MFHRFAGLHPCCAPATRQPATDADSDARQVLIGLLAIIDPGRAARWADAILNRHGGLNAALAVGEARLLPLVDFQLQAVALLAAHRRAALFALREEAAAGPIMATRHDLIDN